LQEFFKKKKESFNSLGARPGYMEGECQDGKRIGKTLPEACAEMGSSRGREKTRLDVQLRGADPGRNLRNQPLSIGTNGREDNRNRRRRWVVGWGGGGTDGGDIVQS